VPGLTYCEYTECPPGRFSGGFSVAAVVGTRHGRESRSVKELLTQNGAREAESLSERICTRPP